MRASVCTSRRPVLIFGALLALLPSPGRAAVMAGREASTVGKGEVVEDDLYIAADTVSVLGTVRGDAVLAGGTVTVAGRVEGDLWVTGGTVEITGEVLGSTRVAAGSATVAGRVGEDLLVAAGELEVAAQASVGRDLWLACSEATLAGKVGRNLHAAADTLSVSGAVAGSAMVRAGTLSLSPEAKIAEDLAYTTTQDARIAPQAQIGGRTIKGQPEERSQSPVVWGVLGWLRTLIGLFLLGLLFVVFFPRFAERTQASFRESPGRTLGFGALALVAVPIGAVLLMVFGALAGGWWLGLFLLALYGMAVVLALPVSGFALGRALLDRLGKRGIHPLVALLAGLALLLLFMAVPVFGFLVGLAAVVWGLGALLTSAARARRGTPQDLALPASAPVAPPP